MPYSNQSSVGEGWRAEYAEGHASCQRLLGDDLTLRSSAAHKCSISIANVGLSPHYYHRACKRMRDRNETANCHVCLCRHKSRAISVSEMASGEGSAGTSEASEKLVEALVSFKNWKRPVRLSGRPAERIGDMQTIRSAFPEVEEKEVNLQIKSEAWGGEYIDVGVDMPIPDRSSLRLLALENDTKVPYFS